MAEIGSAVADKVVDSLFVVAKKEIGYMWNCKENVEKFKNEVESLKVMKSQVQQQIGIAKDKGDNLLSGVEEWLNKADTEISKADEFLEQEANAKKTCFKIGMCGNWATLYHYGKGATQMMTPLLEHKASGTHFVTCVSVETLPPTQLDVYQTKNPEDLVTHNSALNAIIAALEDESKQIIGIYGLGGVGKTTLAMEVAARVKKTDPLFDDVAFTTVSQTANDEKIQKDLENARKRIMQGDKILIILDDVWEKLNLEELCIPSGSNYKNCKILLTSRSKRVCQKMNAQSKICINSLPIEEAWILFKRVVGERVETDADLKPVAEEVAKECGGLPLLIQAVGNALKVESIRSWESALTQLQKHAPLDIDEDIRKAFTHLKLSYDYLKSEEAKSCFLLCSLFPEDYDISLEALVYYMVGLHNLESMEDARDRVRNAVNMLTSSCLLLNTQPESCTKMHDVVRDVALLIASEGRNKYLVEAGKYLKEWQPRNKSLESYTGVSLMYNEISKLPDYEVHLSSLDIFLVRGNRDLSMISHEFIKGMKEVKVLDISRNNISSLPQSFQLLTKLRTLDLCGNKSLHEIAILGVLRDLEILILNGTGITEIPKEIAQLVNLRVLEVKVCVDLSRISQGVISALWRLEELRIEFKLKFKGASDCIVEVMSLSKLTYLDLTVPSIDDIPAQGQGFNSEKLKRFVILIGEEYNGYISTSGRYLVLSSVHLRIPLVKWLKKLIEGSHPVIYLNRIKNLNNIMPTLYDEGFNKLEHIMLDDCWDVSCLVDDGTRCDGDEGKTEEKFFKELKHLKLLDPINLEVLWKCPDEYVSLTNLVTLFIRGSKLVRVFTVSVAQSLVNLKELGFSFCYDLEEVIWGGDGGEEIDRGSEEIVEQQQHSSSSSAANTNIIIVFPSLAKILLWRLWSLQSFFNSKAGNGDCSSIIKYPSLVDVTIGSCLMKMWGPGIHETPNLKTLNYGEPIVLDGPCAINDAVGKVWRNWKQDNHPSDDDESNNDDDDDEFLFNLDYHPSDDESNNDDDDDESDNDGNDDDDDDNDDDDNHPSDDESNNDDDDNDDDDNHPSDDESNNDDVD